MMSSSAIGCDDSGTCPEEQLRGGLVLAAGLVALTGGAVWLRRRLSQRRVERAASVQAPSQRFLAAVGPRAAGASMLLAVRF